MASKTFGAYNRDTTNNLFTIKNSKGMKQAFRHYAESCGAQDFRWYHWAAVAWWCIALMFVTAECAHWFAQVIVVVNFIVATAILKSLPLRETDED